jgi:hypothetical protein
MKGANSGWPLVDRDQDSICIHSLVAGLERLLNAVPNETRVSYWKPGIIDDEGGSIEIQFLCDMLYGIEIAMLCDLECDEMKDGQPRVSVSIQSMWDEELKKHLIEKWELEKEKYPKCKFGEHFLIKIELVYTKNDWLNIIERGREIKKAK